MEVYKNLGELKEVNIREIWPHEEYHFSNWLAKAENIELLNDITGLTLTDIEKETYVGSYRCDLFAKDETTGIKVIIENQLEMTDHDHLGKIITYASGLDANVVIWIVKEAREEHKSAIEWLNNNMMKDISFFLLELHAYKIGDSLPAPKFEVIEQPNDFVKNTLSAKDEDLSKTQINRLEFWGEFREFVKSNGKPFNTKKPSTDHWSTVAIGTSDAHISITLVNQQHKIGVNVYIPDNKDLFDEFYQYREEIEAKLPFPIHWERMSDKKASQIQSFISDFSYDNKDNYPELMQEIMNRVIIMRDVFRGYL